MSQLHITQAPNPLPEGFCELSELIYTQDPHHIPEDKGALERAFSETNPWFAVPEQEAACLCIPEQGRLAVFKPKGLKIDGQRAGFFGYWEAAPESREHQRALFAQAADWAKARGLDVLYGPINFSTYGQYRLRTEAAPGSSCFIGEPYNPDYYPALLEATGVERAQGYVTQISDNATLGAAVRQKLPQVELLRQRGFSIEPLTHERWLSHLPELHGMIDAIFGGNFAYTPLSYESFAQACGQRFIQKADPEASAIMMTPEGQVAGFFLLYPDYGPLVARQAGDERVSPDALDFHTHAHKAHALGSDAGILKTVGVRPELRRMGIMDALTAQIMDWANDRYARWIGALIREDNPSRNFGRAYLLDERGYQLYRLRVP